MKTHSLKILFILFILSINANAQEIVDRDNSVVETDTVSFVMTKSPMGAVLRSAIFPGWGQFYTESYWKIPIVWGVLGWFSYLYIENNKLYKEFQSLYSESLKNGTGNTNYRANRNFYRNERDKFALILGLSYVLNLLDSYVDAHLFDFDVIENPINNQLELSVKFRF